MMILLPRLSRCCFCISLRFGAMIIGYLSLVISTTIISLISVSLYRLVGYVRDHKDKPTQGLTAEQLQTNAIGLYVAHSYFFLVFLLCCIINLMLIIGVLRNNLRLIRYYVTISIVMLVMVLVLVVLAFVFFGLFATLPMLIWSVILYYFIVVVRSAYLEMEELQKPKDIYVMVPLPEPSQQPLMSH